MKIRNLILYIGASICVLPILPQAVHLGAELNTFMNNHSSAITNPLVTPAQAGNFGGDNPGDGGGPPGDNPGSGGPPGGHPGGGGPPGGGGGPSGHPGGGDGGKPGGGGGDWGKGGDRGDKGDKHDHDNHGDNDGSGACAVAGIPSEGGSGQPEPTYIYCHQKAIWQLVDEYDKYNCHWFVYIDENGWTRVLQAKLQPVNKKKAGKGDLFFGN